MTQERGRRFVISDRTVNLTSGVATFDYELDGLAFTERVGFPIAKAPDVDTEAIDVLLDLCHILIGTSYYKLTAPEALEISRPVPPELLGVCLRAYDEGLREFCVVNALPIPLPLDVRAEVTASRSRGLISQVDRPLVPVGGGKDSAAVLALVPDATAVAVSPTEVHRRLAAAAGVPLLEVTRELDPALARLTPSGYNGHIPITAINSAISAVTAHLNGFDAVIMSNERSASEPTRVADGFAVNHQYSKSFEFEIVLYQAMSLGGIAYFSLLRQLSELAIAAIVAGQPRLRDSFLSCNRAFRRSRSENDPQTWCLQCAKCLFTFLCFAPFLDVDSACRIFGGNPLSNGDLVEAVRGLWHDESKPFDCVGERGEAAAAVTTLASLPKWRGMPVVAAVADDARSVQDKLGTDLRSLLEPSGPTLCPAPYDSIAAKAARAIADSDLG